MAGGDGKHQRVHDEYVGAVEGSTERQYLQHLSDRVKHARVRTLDPEAQTGKDVKRVEGQGQSG